MEIDKILFGQLSAGKVDKSFEDLDINSDGKISEEDLSLTQDNEISSAINTVLNSIDQDEDVEILDDDLSFLDENNSASQNVAVTNQTSHTVTSNSSSVESAELQLTKLTKELDEIQEDKEQKENEYKMTEIELEKLQTNYEEAQKKAESGENMEFELTNLKLKINNLSLLLDSLKGDIERLTTKYNAKSLEVESQKQIVNKSISEMQEVKNVVETQNINTVNNTTAINNTTNENKTTTTTQNVQNSVVNKFERKTVSEYITDLQNKFDNLWQQFGNEAEAMQYVNNNLMEFADVDDDGKISPIDLLLVRKYCNSSISSNRRKEEDKDYRLAHNRFNSRLISTINQNKEGYMMNLDDLEYFYQNDGKNLGVFGVVWGNFLNEVPFLSSCNVDFAKISQTENWEERLTKLNQTYGLNKGEKSAKNLSNYIQRLADFIKANPDKANYATVAVNYQIEVAAYTKKCQDAENIDWEQRAKDALSNAESQYKDLIKDSGMKKEYSEFKSKEKFLGCKPQYIPSFAEYCKKIAYGDYVDENCCIKDINTIAKDMKSFFIGKAPAEKGFKGNFDFSNDGQINADDLANFSTDVDLNGDGTVSADEKNYLINTKKTYNTKAWKIVKDKGANNMNTIDVVISYYTNVDVQAKYEDLENILKARKEFLEAYISYMNEKYGRDLKLEDIPALGARTSHTTTNIVVGNTSVFYNGYLDGTGKIIDDCAMKICEANIFELEKLWKPGFEMTEPKNTYLHYVQSADLTKDELQSILNKINSSSEKAQSELREVVKVIEAKLANM